MINVQCAVTWRRDILRLTFGLFFALVFEATTCSSANTYSSIVVTDLKTEHLTNPLGIQSSRPRFRWILNSPERAKLQTAYQILASTSLEKLESNVGDYWDSGKVVSDESVEVLYRGKDLNSAERLFWKVRVWDEHGQPSVYSEPSFFEMGLRKPTDWHGRWIAAEKSISSPIFRRKVLIDVPVKRARIYVCGLGFYELSINGSKVGSRVLEPASTFYNNNLRLALASRVLYSTYDVTENLRIGENAIGVMLGHGWYSGESDASFRTPYGDRPRLILQLNVELTDGRMLQVSSDGSWRTSAGPITYNDFSNGETYDSRLEQSGWNSPGFDDSSWPFAVASEAPSGTLTSELLPSEQVVATLPPVRVITPKEPEGQFFEKTYIYDFGQNFTGWVRIAVSGPRGAKVTLRYGSRLYPEDDTLDTRSNETPVAGARQADVYILKGENEEVWEPRFTLHGFRYVEVRGFKDTPSLSSIEGRVVHSALEPTGSFTSSNELINKIHNNIQWTLSSSLHGLPQDAADRAEREGWVGDPGFVTEDYIYNYEMLAFSEKWLDDIQDTQSPEGLISIMSPLPFSGKDVSETQLYEAWPSWQITYPLLAWQLYQYYGDREVLIKHYNSLKRLTDALIAAARGDLLLSEPIGDHMEPQVQGYSRLASRHTPSALTANAHYYYHAWLLASIAKTLGREKDARTYGALAERIRASFNRKFYNSATHQYASGSQTSNALPLFLGIVPPDQIPMVMKNLVEDVEEKHSTHMSTGIIGSNALVQVLPRYGAAELMYSIANQTTYPSLGHQVKMGATTVCETYECSPSTSQNMKMFGSVDKFFYRNLAGILPASPGFRRVLIRPMPLSDLRSARGQERTVRGVISVDWFRGDNSLELLVSVPVGSDADIAVPTLGLRNPRITEGVTMVWESAKYVPGVAGILAARHDQDNVVFRTGSGSYRFIVSSTSSR